MLFLAVVVSCLEAVVGRVIHVVNVSSVLARGCLYHAFNEVSGWWCCSNGTISVDVLRGIRNASVRVNDTVSSLCSGKFPELYVTVPPVMSVGVNWFAVLAVFLVGVWFLVVVPVICYSYRCLWVRLGCCPRSAPTSGSSGVPLVHFSRSVESESYVSVGFVSGPRRVGTLSTTVAGGSEGRGVPRHGPLSLFNLSSPADGF